jgi:hypothetical protein
MQNSQDKAGWYGRRARLRMRQRPYKVGRISQSPCSSFGSSYYPLNLRGSECRAASRQDIAVISAIPAEIRCTYKGVLWRISEKISLNTHVNKLVFALAAVGVARDSMLWQVLQF